MESDKREQHKERGGHGGGENGGQTSRKVVVSCHRPEQRKIVGVIGRRCDGQPRSRDNCAQISLTARKGNKERERSAHVREVVLQR